MAVITFEQREIIVMTFTITSLGKYFRIACYMTEELKTGEIQKSKVTEFVGISIISYVRQEILRFMKKILANVWE